jgi:hypothetical protein
MIMTVLWSREIRTSSVIASQRYSLLPTWIAWPRSACWFVGLFGARGENPEEIPSLPGPHFRNG